MLFHLDCVARLKKTANLQQRSSRGLQLNLLRSGTWL